MEGWTNNKVERRESMVKYSVCLRQVEIQDRRRCVIERSGPRGSLCNLLTLVIIHMSRLNDDLVSC